MAGRDSILRAQIGIALRFPVVALLGLLWVICLWWWVAVIRIVFALLWLILKPIFYPLIYILVWVYMAFMNSSDPVLPYYWSEYPAWFFVECRDSFKLGFPTLRKWLIDGWE